MVGRTATGKAAALSVLLTCTPGGGGVVDAFTTSIGGSNFFPSTAHGDARGRVSPPCGPNRVGGRRSSTSTSPSAGTTTSSLRMYVTSPHHGSNTRDFFSILGVTRGAGASEIKQAYRKLAKRYHPDANRDTDTTEKFMEINRAYEVLSDSDLRSRYERFGESGIGTSAASDKDGVGGSPGGPGGVYEWGANSPFGFGGPGYGSPFDGVRSGGYGYGYGYGRSTTDYNPFDGVGAGPRGRATASPFDGVGAGYGGSTDSASRAGGGTGYHGRSTDFPFGGRGAATDYPYAESGADYGQDDDPPYGGGGGAGYYGRTVGSPFGGTTGGVRPDKTDAKVDVSDIFDPYFGGGGSAETAESAGRWDSASASAGPSSSAGRWDPGPNDREGWANGAAATGASVRGPRAGPMIGNDVRLDLEVDFETATAGGDQTVHVTHLETCQTCDGDGAAPGTSAKTCRACNGAGGNVQVTRTPLGAIHTQQECQVCGGSGRVVEQYCGTCAGQGRTTKTKAIKVTIPPGVKDGSMLRVHGEGDSGPNGGPAGDLYIFVTVKQDGNFRSEGSDVHSDVTIGYFDAILGSTVNVPVLGGEEVTIKIPPGTQPGTVMRLQGNGAPRRGDENNRGDHFVTINVDIPSKMSKEEEQLLNRLKDLNLNGGSESETTKKTGLGGFFRNAFS